MIPYRGGDMKNLLLFVFFACFFCLLSSQQNYDWQWVNHAGSVSYDCGTGIVCDAEGNSYVTGQFVGSATFGDITLESYGDFDVFVAKVDSEGNYLWASRAGGPSWEYVNGIAQDASGNCYITGYYTSSAQFGSTTLSCSGYDDIYIAKIDTLGNWQWVVSVGGTARDAARSIACDNAGNIYIAGSIIGTVDFGGTVLTCGAQKDGFVAKLNNNGNWLWAAKIGGTNDDYVTAITTDHLGNCYITGTFKSNGTAGAIILFSRGQEDVFIAKLDSTGSFVWAKTAGGANADEGSSIAVDSTYCYVTGRFESSATFGTTVLPSAGEKDIFVAKLSLDGSYIWTKSAGGAGTDFGSGICADATGNIYVVGSYQLLFYMGSSYLMSCGSYNIFVTQLDAEGTFTWVLEAGGVDVDHGSAIALDTQGNIYLTGSFFDEADFGDISIAGFSYYDVFVAKVAPQGVPVTDENTPGYHSVTYLADAYPNPVSKGGSSTITASLPRGETGEISIYNLKGQLVETHLIYSGEQHISFPNIPLPAGVYFYRLRTPSRTEMKKLVLLR